MYIYIYIYNIHVYSIHTTLIIGEQRGPKPPEGAPTKTQQRIYICMYIYIYIERERYTHTHNISLSLYIYMYIHIYICIYVYVCVCIYIYIHIYIYIYTCSARLDPRERRLNSTACKVDITRNMVAQKSFFSYVVAKTFQGLGPKRLESSNGDRVYTIKYTCLIY